MIGITEAILSLRSDAQVSVEADDIAKITWHDGNPTNLTAEQIQAEQVVLQAAYDALDYARLRAVAYPPLSKFVEAYTEKTIGNDPTKWNAYVIAYNAVRTDNPKVPD